MGNERALDRVLRQLADDIRLFIDLSLRETDASWDEWLRLVSRQAGVKCWERKRCNSPECPAYMLTDRRCWHVAGTMCGGTVKGEFALKYKSCTECEVYRDAVFSDPVTEIFEHVLTLVHSFRLTQDKLRAMATRDPMTGLYNRTFFNEILLNEVERTRRYGSAFSLVLLDIDNFKWINDTYGHIFGDKIIRDCATILTRSVRASDILVRYGGDEFLVVIPGDEDRECEEVMGRIKSMVDEWNLRHASPDYDLSLSAGCARYADGMEVMNVLKQADERMYMDKRAGGTA
jgi:diguanylate cyclase (GGDEF)-like protein